VKSYTCALLSYRYGLFLRLPVARNDMIVEYMGETVRGPVADLRERVYEEQAVGSCYLFRLDRLEVGVCIWSCRNEWHAHTFSLFVSTFFISVTADFYSCFSCCLCLYPFCMCVCPLFFFENIDCRCNEERQHGSIY